MIPRDLETVLVAWMVPEVLQTDLVDHTSDNLLSFGIPLTPSPTGDFQEVVLLGTQCERDGVAVKGVAQVVPACQSGGPPD